MAPGQRLFVKITRESLPQVKDICLSTWSEGGWR